MAIKNNREYRMASVEFRALENEDNKYIVEGYATTWNEPYVMYSYEGKDYSEQIDRHALDNADISDVIFLYNHEGMVYARLSNNTLTIDLDEKGLHIVADLSSTEQSRQMFESIKAGLVTQMSWSFTIADGGDRYDEKKRLRTIMGVKRVYDVSAVSIPANPATDISARTYFDGVIEEGRRRDREAEEIRERIRKIIEGESK